MNATRARLIKELQVLMTPIDFDHLTQNGVFKESHDGWYEVADMERLPEHARHQMSASKATSFTDAEGRTTRKVYAKFRRSDTTAKRLLIRLTATPPTTSN